MTTSTAPITLPAQHRQEVAVWPLHIAIAWAVYAVAAAIAAARIAAHHIDFRAERASRTTHIAVIISATSLIVTVLAALAVLSR